MIDPVSVANILTRLQNLGPVRKSPLEDDLQGDFDGWFEGGAYREVTGYTTYAFHDGIEASIGVHPGLSVSIRFPNGAQVSVVERASSPTLLVPMDPTSDAMQLHAPMICGACGRTIAPEATHQVVDGVPFHISCTPRP